ASTRISLLFLHDALPISRHVVQVSSLGKWKTTFQMIAIGCLIFYKPLFGLPVFEIGVALLYVAALLTLTSMITYLKAALPVLVRSEEHTSELQSRENLVC